LAFIDVNKIILINIWYNSFKGGCLMDLILTAHKIKKYMIKRIERRSFQ